MEYTEGVRFDSLGLSPEIMRAIQRREPNFQCFPLVRREEVQAAAAAELVDKVFGGSASLLFASLLSGKQLPPEEVQRLRTLIDELE